MGAAPARTDTAVARCPVSDLKPGCGIAPVPRLLSAGVTVRLGTDGAVSSSSPDVLGAMRQTALVPEAGGDPTAVGAEQAVRMATLEGAPPLGLGERLGSLEAGERADLIVVELTRGVCGRTTTRGRRSRTPRTRRTCGTRSSTGGC